jgi:hypothetical protein
VKGQVIASGKADLHRDDLVPYGFPEAGFRLSIIADVKQLLDRDIFVTFTGTDVALNGTPVPNPSKPILDEVLIPPRQVRAGSDRTVSPQS